MRGVKPDTVFAYLAGIDGKGVDAPIIQQAALRRTRELGAQYNIFTDGSAREGVADGGAGLVVTTGEMDNPSIVETLLREESILLVLSKRRGGLCRWLYRGLKTPNS